MDTLDDIQLMQRVQAGDQAAFSVLVHRHQQPLLNFFARLGAYTETEDLVQETLIRVFGYRQRYAPTAKFTTFLYTVARHVWIDRLRKIKRAEVWSEAYAAEAETAHDGDMARLHARLDVDRALEQLPGKLRDVVVLAVFQGLGYEEVAEILDIPVGTVKSRMFLAMNNLRAFFDASNA